MAVAASELQTQASEYAGHRVQRRNGAVAEFDVGKIEAAIKSAIIDVEGPQASGSQHIVDMSRGLAREAANGALRGRAPGNPVPIEDIQDYVELALMRNGHHRVAREYVLYREARAAERAAQASQTQQAQPAVNVEMPDGQMTPAANVYEPLVHDACEGIEGVSARTITDAVATNIYDGLTLAELDEALLLCARQQIEAEPNYSYVAARLLMARIRSEVTAAVGVQVGPRHAEMVDVYPAYFRAYVAAGIEKGKLDPAMDGFDLDALGAAIDPERDLAFTYLGLQTLYDRYLLHTNGTRYESPQALYMRVAMGLALNEDDPTARAIEFYRVLSSFDFMSSTPTLFNAGTVRSQLSSCYLTSIADDLSSIYGGIHDNALLSKFAGGLGNDWTNVRSLGAHIKGTNGKSQGVVPFLKVANDTAVAVNQGGVRKGAVCAYLETWHKDIEEFLDLRKNTGDERRRCHDMNTANWIPDLFVKRVLNDGKWSTNPILPAA